MCAIKKHGDLLRKMQKKCFKYKPKVNLKT